MCRLSWSLGASTSGDPLGLSRPVMGLLFTILDIILTLCVICGFARCVNDNFAFIGCYAEYVGGWLPTFRDSLYVRVGSTDCAETSVIKNKPTQRNISEGGKPRSKYVWRTKQVTEHTVMSYNINVLRLNKEHWIHNAHPRIGHEDPEWKYRGTPTVNLPFHLTSALHGGRWLTPRPGRLTAGTDPLSIYRRLGGA